jgi:outer membrane lipoprotein-sorting protein
LTKEGIYETMKQAPMQIRFFGVFILITTMFSPTLVSSQEFITPLQFFDQVSDTFTEIEDYQAEITIDQNEGELISGGTVLYKRPNKLRISFLEPRDQVLAYNGEMLTLYIPELSVVLEQETKVEEVEPALVASSEGLSLLRKNYGIAYLEGPDPVPLDEGSEELVVWLQFKRISAAEGFKHLEIAFDEERMIRRIKGETQRQEMVVDFRKIRINQNIPDAIFDYTAPSNANVYKNFLYELVE